MANNSPEASCRPLEAPVLYNGAFPKTFNLAQYLLDKATSAFADKIALAGSGKAITFKRLKELSYKAGNVLRNYGVETEQRVLIATDDSIYSICAFLGAIAIGAIPVPISQTFPEYELRQLLEDTRARLAVCDGPLKKFLREHSKSSYYLKTVMSMDPQSTLEFLSLPEELQYASDDLKIPPTSPDEMAYWLYTAGRTGFPKAVEHMHHTPLVICETYGKEVLNLTEEDTICTTGRLFTAQGVMGMIFFPLYFGCTALITPTQVPDPEDPENSTVPATTKDLTSFIREHRPSVFLSSPNFYEDILTKTNPAISKERLASLRLCVSTCAPLSPTLSSKWQSSMDKELLNGFMTTESAYIFISNRIGDVRPGCLGKVVPGFEVRLENERGLPVGPGEVGNLLVRGESLFAGYRNRRLKQQKTYLGIWLNTGDKCLRDDDGYFYYSGRNEEMFNIDNNWVSPAEIEHDLLELEPVAEAAVVTSLDENGESRLRAYLVLKPDIEPSSSLSAELRLQVNADKSPSHQVSWITFVPSLPRSVTGHLQRYKLK